ncbi:uncharacterized protein LOC116286445 [Actinia tenebrosa]|uniref:Uncharacterized protein LOC116286445 n=1 Tax=Actinia tenebrosa TaxID=6105 RepID=A0A6P8H0A6_ACTTE|nr:uncharacterized protein LOC116286445 [Actinia tenebrosa]
MNIVDENGKLQEDENSLWLPFEHYEDQNDTKNFHCTSIIWKHDYATYTELISHSFPWPKPDSKEVGHNHSEFSDKSSTCKCAAKELCYEQCISYSKFFIDQRSKEYWDKLLQSSRKKKKVLNKQKSIWNQSYVNVLPLNKLCINRQEAPNDDIKESTLNDGSSFSKNEVKCNFVLTSDESESEDSGDVVDESDPMYSRFAVIRNSFHTSEDGIVFYCQKELDIYKAKMAEMEDLLERELKQIKYQHDQLRAKRAEQRKLLSGGADSSNDHDSHEEEPTEKDALNSDNSRQGTALKQERKSAIFSSIHDVFSYARTGIQGMFVKTSPNSARKVKTNDASDSEGSDDEEDTKINDSTSSIKHSAPLLDNHDEFTRQMTSEGGLKYESSDKSVQQLSYQNLPPPLSLNSLQDKRSKS